MQTCSCEVSHSSVGDGPYLTASFAEELISLISTTGYTQKAADRK